MSDSPAIGGSKIWTVLTWLAGLKILLMLGLFVAIGSSLFKGSSLDAHIQFGGPAGLLTIVMLLVAAIGRAGRTAWLVPLIMVVMHVIQHALPAAPNSVAMLHPLNATLILLTTFWYFTWLRRGAAGPHRTQGSRSPTSPTDPQRRSA